MADKYLIYTMGIPEIIEAVQKVLFEKGYRWPFDNWHGEVWFPKNRKEELFVIYLEPDLSLAWDVKGFPKESHNYQELTFRQLVEDLPPIHDEAEELASKINLTINKYWKDKVRKFHYHEWASQQDWCKVWEKLKPKLGL